MEQDRTSLALEAPDRIETVRGPIAADRLGVALMHEHILVDFIGAAEVSPSRLGLVSLNRARRLLSSLSVHG